MVPPVKEPVMSTPESSETLLAEPGESSMPTVSVGAPNDTWNVMVAKSTLPPAAKMGPNPSLARSEASSGGPKLANGKKLIVSNESPAKKLLLPPVKITSVLVVDMPRVKAAMETEIEPVFVNQMSKLLVPPASTLIVAGITARLSARAGTEQIRRSGTADISAVMR
jgi:hypothetical protein